MRDVRLILSGLCAGVCVVGVRVLVLFVRPCVWVRAILKGQPGEGKARALGYVARRFPGAELTPPRCRAPRDGRADALCLAVWGLGRRNMGRRG
jgi:crossover junction endodeoxyribonuclease RuvC